MCRTTDYFHHSNNNDRFIRLKSLSVCLSPTTPSTVSHLPEFATLVFLPRINGSFLEINASKYRPDSPAFMTLHRDLHSDAVFASHDGIRACDGAVFEVHVGESRLLRGVLRRSDDSALTMNCKSILSKDCGVKEVEVCVAAENGVVMREKVEVVVKRRRSRYCRKFEIALEEIPEERESDVVEDEEESDGACCCCGEGESESGSDGGEEDEEEEDPMMEMEMEKEIEGVKWAVDMGIWAVCLGVGFVVTRASARKLRRRHFLL